MGRERHRAEFRFYGDLNDFLPVALRGAAFPHAFDGTPAVKDVIEAIGVPHPEVDLVVIDGRPSGFSARVHAGARVAVFPAFHALDLPAEARLIPRREGPRRFVLDGHLGRLARYLRLLGFDTRYDADADDASLASSSAREERILLTRDRGLLKRGEVVLGRWVRATDPLRQLAEIARAYGLAGEAAPYTRCLRCNGPLRAASREEARALVPAEVLVRHDAFQRCDACGRVFWRGSHFARLRSLVELAAAAERSFSPGEHVRA